MRGGGGDGENAEGEGGGVELMNAKRRWKDDISECVRVSRGGVRV